MAEGGGLKRGVRAVDGRGYICAKQGRGSESGDPMGWVPAVASPSGGRSGCPMPSIASSSDPYAFGR